MGDLFGFAFVVFAGFVTTVVLKERFFGPASNGVSPDSPSETPSPTGEPPEDPYQDPGPIWDQHDMTEEEWDERLPD